MGKDNHPKGNRVQVTWRCEANLTPLLDGYLEWVIQEVGEINLGGLKSQWYSAARELREELTRYRVPESEWKAFVLWACKIMAKKEPPLINKNHRSLVWAVPQWRKRKRGETHEDRQRYLKWTE